MWKILITIIICLVVALCFAVAAARMKARADRAWPPQPPSPHGAVQFTASLPTEPRFKIISITGQPQDPPATQPLATDGRLGGPADFTAIQITENPAGICKLTGNRVKDCTCDRHRTRS
jgi:hypothetical protein